MKNMLYSGLVSVTFRHLSPEEIVDLSLRAGVDGIEWGGDIHVPHGDTDRAAQVLTLTRNAGLLVASYGSYYRVGEENGFSFGQVLDTAKALEAPVIRVWAGKRGSAESDNNYWSNVVDDARKIADAAAKEHIQVAFEFHGNTLTDTNDSCLKLLNDIDNNNIKTYWQPPVTMGINERKEGLRMILPWLSHIHVFHWMDGNRLPLEDGTDEWKEYMEIIKSVEGSRYAMIEFVRDNSPQQFIDDANCLKKIISG